LDYIPLKSSIFKCEVLVIAPFFHLLDDLREGRVNESWSACELLRSQDPESPEGSRIIFLTQIFSANPSHVQNTRTEGEIVRRRMRGSDDEDDVTMRKKMMMPMMKRLRRMRRMMTVRTTKMRSPFKPRVHAEADIDTDVDEKEDGEQDKDDEEDDDDEDDEDADDGVAEDEENEEDDEDDKDDA